MTIDTFKTALVLDDVLYKQVTEIIREGELLGDMSRFNDFEAFKSSEINEFSLLIYAFKDINEPREIFSYIESIDSELAIVIIYPEGKISTSDYKDLIINGASGLVPDANLKSLFQHIIRLQEKYLAGNNKASLFDELFENYFDGSESLISLINSDLKYESVNESFSKFHQLKRDELKGLCPSTLWGEEAFKSEISANIMKCLKGEIVRYKAYFGDDKDSGKCYEVVYRPFQPPGADKPFTLVETRDITDIEVSLKVASKATERNFYYENYLPFGLFECNCEGEIISANDTFYNILEIPANKRDSVNLKDYTRTDNRFSGYLKSVHQGESSTFSQIPMSTLGGSEIYTRISSHARAGEGEEIVVNATLEDNTREVLLEKKLSQTHRIETLGTLAGGIAHDFNTILTTITGYSELSMDELESNSSVYDYLTRILHSVDRAEDIVNQMLTFSRQIDIELVAVKIEDVVEEVCNFMQSALPHEISLNHNIEKIEGYAKADPTQLFRVFLNIMTNSMQAMEGSSGKLDIQTFQSSFSDRDYANITITDTGKGIDKAIIDRIYEPFFTTKNPGEGTGMGLAVAHGIITSLGGEIMVESTLGKGTIFTIKIPVYEQNEIPEPSVDEKQKSGTILFADNNVHFSRTVSLALERLGYNVRQASVMSDIDAYLEHGDQQDEIIFFRCSFESDIKDKMLKKIVDMRKNARIVLISKPGSTNYRSLTQLDKKRISVLFEPVTLRDIVSSIQNRC